MHSPPSRRIVVRRHCTHSSPHTLFLPQTTPQLAIGLDRLSAGRESRLNKVRRNGWHHYFLRTAPHQFCPNPPISQRCSRYYTSQHHCRSYSHPSIASRSAMIKNRTIGRKCECVVWMKIFLHVKPRNSPNLNAAAAITTSITMAVLVGHQLLRATELLIREGIIHQQIKGEFLDDHRLIFHLEINELTHRIHQVSENNLGNQYCKNICWLLCTNSVVNCNSNNLLETKCLLRLFYCCCPSFANVCTHLFFQNVAKLAQRD